MALPPSAMTRADVIAAGGAEGLPASTFASGSSAAAQVADATSRTDANRLNNPFNPVLKKIVDGQDATILAWTDSTGVRSPTRRYLCQWADALIATGRLPETYGIRIYEWGGSGYGTAPAETLRTGTAGRWLNIFLASVSGSIPRYFMGGFFYRGLAVPEADMVFLAHGFNLNTFTNIEGEYVTAIEQYRTLRPEVPFLATTQHPFQANSNGETSFRPALLKYANILGISVDDSVYQEYLRRGKPDVLYNAPEVPNGLHESHGTGFWVKGADTGVNIYVDMLNRWYDNALPLTSVRQVSRLVTPAANQQLLLNGDFAEWSNTAVAPDGWTSNGTIAFSKDVTNFADPRKPFSVRMTATGGAASIQRAVAANRTSYAGLGPISFVARMKKDTDGNGSVGRLTLSWNSAAQGSGSISSTGNTVQQDDFSWVGLVGVMLPSDITTLFARINVDTSATPIANKGIWLDQVSLVSGGLPLAYR